MRPGYLVYEGTELQMLDSETEEVQARVRQEWNRIVQIHIVDKIFTAGDGEEGVLARIAQSLSISAFRPRSVATAITLGLAVSSMMDSRSQVSQIPGGSGTKSDSVSLGVQGTCPQLTFPGTSNFPSMVVPTSPASLDSTFEKKKAPSDVNND
ncbi:hypothetical protein QFC24_003008 [Naganishia onofrii]|uniref:Uncharacterized protein n=1 Tax=Naganishia onofrii TaxID=1851511 RepID=A0ACC2XLX5_9TREE|nr:hypothetical protein QFC24_003008 [Naganishia onofrii]